MLFQIFYQSILKCIPVSMKILISTNAANTPNISLMLASEREQIPAHVSNIQKKAFKKE